MQHRWNPCHTSTVYRLKTQWIPYNISIPFEVMFMNSYARHCSCTVSCSAHFTTRWHFFSDFQKCVVFTKWVWCGCGVVCWVELTIVYLLKIERYHLLCHPAGILWPNGVKIQISHTYFSAEPHPPPKLSFIWRKKWYFTQNLAKSRHTTSGRGNCIASCSYAIRRPAS